MPENRITATSSIHILIGATGFELVHPFKKPVKSRCLRVIYFLSSILSSNLYERRVVLYSNKNYYSIERIFCGSSIKNEHTFGEKTQILWKQQQN